MVLFSNINLNQRVELLYKNQVIKGTVKYKGPVQSLDGDWVGLALDVPVGVHNGLYRGRRYYECKFNHGVFVRAGNVRFVQNTRRRMFNKYYRCYDTGVDDTLFGGANPQPAIDARDQRHIDIGGKKYGKNIHSADLFDSLGSRFSSSSQFPLSGSVSRRLPAATMTRPMTAAAAYTYTSQPIESRERDMTQWEPVPSIPKTHMPHSAQVSQTRRGWDKASWTRELSYPKARQVMKSNAWNDVSF